MTHGRLSATLISVLLVCFSLPIPAPRSDNLALRMLWLTQQPDKPNCRRKEDQTLGPGINNESRFSSGRDTSNSENVFVADFNNDGKPDLLTSDQPDESWKWQRILAFGTTLRYAGNFGRQASVRFSFHE